DAGDPRVPGPEPAARRSPGHRGVPGDLLDPRLHGRPARGAAPRRSLGALTMASIGQGDIRPGQAADFLGGRWSKLYPSEDQFRLANVPSGLAGATARGVVSLDNNPNTIAAI